MLRHVCVYTWACASAGKTLRKPAAEIFRERFEKRDHLAQCSSRTGLPLPPMSQGSLYVFRIANGVAAHIVIEVDIDIEAVFQPRADLRNISIQVLFSIVPAISFAVV